MQRLYISFFCAIVSVLAGASACFADFAMPSLPTTNLETAGTAVAALVGVYVVIKLAIRMLKGN
jgi:hypothetical protein